MHRLTQEDELELFELLPVAAQQAVARGDVTLEDLLDRVTRSAAAELCPRCCARPVTHPRLGLCGVCAYEELAHAHYEALAELEAKRDYDALKQRLKKLRQALGVKAPGRWASPPRPPATGSTTSGHDEGL